MSARAVVLGLFGACVVCGITYFNDAVMRQTYLIGNHMPIAVYGGLILVILLLNPLMWRLSKGRAFSAKELTIILALTLAACCVPSSGLMRTFSAAVILPHHYNRTDPGWRGQGVLKMVPKQMLAEAGEDQGKVLSGFIQGLPPKEGHKHISFFDIPWAAWSGTLWFWLPLILTLWIALIGLSVVVHRQWSIHEQLPYPIATFASSLLPAAGQARGAVFRSRLFWLGTALVLSIHLINVAHVYFPKLVIPVQMVFDLEVLTARLYPMVVAFAYFLATDVSLSLGVGPYLSDYVTGIFASYGVSFYGGGWYQPKIQSFLAFGGYLSMFLALLYMGRHFYGHVFRRALGLSSANPLPSAPIWGARVFLVSLAGFVGMMCRVGVDWQIALLYVLMTVMLFLVMSRILAETGVFFIQPFWTPCMVLAGIFGTQAIEPATLLILMLISTVLVIDPREALMPFMVNSLKLLDLRQVRIGRSSLLCTVALVLGLAVAIPVTFYFQYDRGMNKSDGWAINGVPRLAFEEAVRVKQRLVAQGNLDLANSISGWGRFTHMRPNLPCLLAFGAGAGLVALFAICRLRFPRWPFHPVLFLVWLTYSGHMMAFSFLVGWLIKFGVTKYGGAGGYQKLKPLMFGVIAGEMLGGIVQVLIGLIYYLTTGRPPERFWITPG